MSKPKCGECRRKFRTESALQMHNKSKHPHRATAPQRTRKGLVGVFFASMFGSLVAIGLSVGAYVSAVTHLPEASVAQIGLVKTVLKGPR
jgi:dolichol kinase